ncbi:hypothetical protein N4Q68_11295 [Salmonella enterica subsp. enterica serovar Montevideo]
MATIVSDPTITQTESLWQTVRTVRRRQGSGGEPFLQFARDFPSEYRMATIVSDPTITQTESLWQTVRTVRRRQGSGGEP